MFWCSQQLIIVSALSIVSSAIECFISMGNVFKRQKTTQLIGPGSKRPISSPERATMIQPKNEMKIDQERRSLIGPNQTKTNQTAKNIKIEMG